MSTGRQSIWLWIKNILCLSFSLCGHGIMSFNATSKANGWQCRFAYSMNRALNSGQQMAPRKANDHIIRVTILVQIWDIIHRDKPHSNLIQTQTQSDLRHDSQKSSRQGRGQSMHRNCHRLEGISALSSFSALYWEVGGWGRVPFSRNLMKPTPRRQWYLTTGRRFH